MTRIFWSVSAVFGLALAAIGALSWNQGDGLALASAALSLILLLLAGLLVFSLRRRMAAEARQAREAHATLARALAAIPDGFLLCDAQDNVVMWNERYLELFPWLRPLIDVGVPYETFVDVAARAVLMPDDADGSRRQQWRDERLQQHRSGASMHEQALSNGLVIHAIERRTPDGGIVSTYRDITRTERDLTRAKAQAEAASEAKTQFLATMSHEIRTPLNGVLGINSLLMKTPLNETQRSYTQMIEASGRTLLALVSDVLDLTRIEAGRMTLEKVDFNPTEIAREVVQTLTPTARNKQLGLDLRASPEPGPWLIGDPNRLRQVLFNLIGNALKFTERGQVTVEMSTTELHDGWFELDVRVRDTGIGIPSDVLARLFDRFVQADGSTARRFGGSGLGLAICREITQLMGGHLSAESQPGTGSVFRLTASLPPAQTRALPAASDDASGKGDDAQHLHILVAEDNEVNQVVIEALLGHMGHTCELVGDGRTAVNRARDTAFDCVLMDIQMPEVDGHQATREIRRLAPPRGLVPIIALTANAMSDDERLAREAGMDAYLSKPIQAEALEQVLQQLHASRSAGAEAARSHS